MARLIKTLSPKEDKQQTSSDILKSLMQDKNYSGDIYNSIVPLGTPISSGSIILDSVVKIRSGQVVRLVGKGAEQGKTSLSFVLAENYMKAMPKSKTIFVKAEGRLSTEMKQRVGLNFVDSPDEWVEGTVFVLSCNVFETVAKIIVDTLKSGYECGENICIIIDSLDGLILKKDLEKHMDGEAKVAGVPKLTKELFRHLALPIAHYDALLLVTGQYAAEIKIDPYAPNIPRQASSSGGSAIGHQSDYVFEFQPRYNGDYILEKPKEQPDQFKNKVKGLWVKLAIRKSANDVSGITVKYPIQKGKVGNCIWKSLEVCDMMIAYEMVEKSGSWFKFPDDIREKAQSFGLTLQEKVQGYDNLLEYLQQPENKNVLDFFTKEVLEIIEE